MAVYLVCYVISFILARQHVYMLSGLVLIGAAVWLYRKDYKRTGNLIHLRGLFCLFFVGGQGISCFKLSALQTDWSIRTWLCFFLAVAAFWLAFEALTRLFDGWTTEDMELGYRFFACRTYRKADGGRGSRLLEPPLKTRRILKAMAAVTAVSYAAFFFEVWKLRFIPMFSYGVPHAYSYFHVSGVHYFTVSSVLVPSFSVVYFFMVSKRGRGLTGDGGIWLALVLDALALAIPILCVSRFQLILAVGMAVFTFISMVGSFDVRLALLLALFLVPAYFGLTVLRSHSVEYLNGIFEMKNSRMPIFITQPYMYIANNYDNFNCLVENLTEYAMGLRMLFPLWAFTGLKFVRPSLVSFPLYVTKEELTTVTLIYDAYYDFGMAGVALFCAVLGAAAFGLVRGRRKLTCPVGHVIYAQIAMYMMLSFFTTWFSNPATWFYLAVTVMVYLYVKF